MKFTDLQIGYIEDKIINALSPVYMILQEPDKITETKIKLMLGRIEKTVKIIRNLRPKHKRIPK